MAWNLTADGVWNLLVADFWNHASAGDGLLNHLWNPLLATDSLGRTLNADHLGAAWVARVNNALLNNWARNAFCLSDPFAAANVNCVRFGHRLADGVAHVFVAGFCFCFIRRAAHVFVAGLINRLADVVTDCSVAGLINRLANRVAYVAVAGLVARLANLAGHITVAGFVHRLANVVGAGLVAGRVDRLADRVALVTVAGFVDVLGAGDWDGFCALVVHSLHAGILLSFPDDFLNRVTL